jgi:hypothetical protein
MKKLLNISALLLALALFCSLSCQSWLRSQAKTQKAAPGLSAGDIFKEQTRTPVTVPPAETVSTPVTPQPTTIESGMIAVNESGSSVVSRAYPWPECGIVRVDKSMPNEVGLNRPFKYTINLTNLTDTTLTGITMIEELPEHFKFMSAVPTAKEDGSKLIWEVASLGPKATRQFVISGTATNIETLKHCTTVITPVIPACATVQVIQPELKLTMTAPA